MDDDLRQDQISRVSRRVEPAMPPKTQKNPAKDGAFQNWFGVGSALAGFEPALGLVDHIDATLAAHHAAIAMTGFQRTKRVPDFHTLSPFRGACRAGVLVPQVLRR